MTTPLCKLQQAHSDVRLTQTNAKAVFQQQTQPMVPWCFLTGAPLSFQRHTSSLPQCSWRGAVPLLHFSEGAFWLPYFSCSKMPAVFWAQSVGPRQSSCSWSPAPRLPLGGAAGMPWLCLAQLLAAVMLQILAAGHCFCLMLFGSACCFCIWTPASLFSTTSPVVALSLTASFITSSCAPDLTLGMSFLYERLGKWKGLLI